MEPSSRADGNGVGWETQSSAHGRVSGRKSCQDGTMLILAQNHIHNYYF